MFELAFHHRLHEDVLRAPLPAAARAVSLTALAADKSALIHVANRRHAQFIVSSA